MSDSQHQSEAVDQIAAALVGFQYELSGAKKDSANPYFKSKYADLESCLAALKEPLHKHGLAVVQTSRMSYSGPVLVTTLLHKSGQFLRGELPLSAAKPNDPQAQGSAITYARRYALAAITGLVQVDDDAEAAVGRGKTEPVKKSEVTSSSVKETAKPSSVSTAESQKPTAEKPVALPDNEPVGPEQMSQLLKVGQANGWNKAQITAFLYAAFELTPATIKSITWKQWEKAVRLISMPQNADGKVIFNDSGKELPADKRFPRGA